MEKLSLYINHQLVSQLIKDLENIVEVCYEELDQQYQTYELRAPIYEHFILEIAKMYHTSPAALKCQTNQIKDQQGDLLKDELQAKQEDLKQEFQQVDQLEQSNEAGARVKLGKGRPAKFSQAEKQLASWLKSQAESGKIRFLKTQIDNYYREFLPASKRKKQLPMNNTLRLLKKFNLNNIFVVTRNGNQKSIKDLPDTSKQVNKQRKQYDKSLQVKDEYVEDQGSKQPFYVQHYESQEEQSQPQYLPFEEIQFQQEKPRKKNMAKLNAFNKERRQNSTCQPNEVSNCQPNEINGLNTMMEIQSNHQSDTPWQKMLNFDNESQTQMKKVEIYENSKSFESQQLLFDGENFEDEDV